MSPDRDPSASELRDQLQRTLGDAYTLERELGGGGMSRVFVAEETALAREGVVKVLPPALSGGVKFERFKREIQVAARLQHAHIVPVLTAGETNGLPYYTMPFVDGESLRARLIRGGALPLTECISVLRDVSRALAYAHDRGIVHRDIKPDNVMLSSGSAVVTDFGIAKAISASPSGSEWRRTWRRHGKRPPCSYRRARRALCRGGAIARRHHPGCTAVECHAGGCGPRVAATG
jgi:serine/threonine-protein kinase